MPFLLAIGGHTGTGKTTMAYGLRKSIPELKDALLIEEDQVRREILGYDLKVKMKQEDYSSEVSRRVREEMDMRIILALKAGQSVIDSSGFYAKASRRHIEKLAEQVGVMFLGVWLIASRKAMIERIEKRLAEREMMDELSFDLGHASDACVGVLDRFGDLGVPTSSHWRIQQTDEPFDKALSSVANAIRCFLEEEKKEPLQQAQ